MLSVKQKRASVLLMISCCVIFLSSVGLKSVYSSALVAIRSEFNLDTVTPTRIGSLIYYIAYGLAQILMVIFIKKINVGKILLYASVGTALVYSTILFTNAMWQMWIILGICGILDAPLWSGCIYFISKYLKKQYLTKANSFMSISTPLGFALAFGVVSMFIALNAWKFSYLFLTFIMLLACVVFYFSERKAKSCLEVIEKQSQNNSGEQLSNKTKRFYFLVVLYLAICVAIVGGATYSINQIMPELIKNVYGYPDAISTLVTTLLPVFNAIVNVILFKLIANGVYYLKILLFVSVACLISAVALLFIFELHIIVLLIVAVVFSCTLSAITIFICGVLPLQIRDKYNSASSSALTNGLLALSAGVMPFLSAMLMDLGGGMAFKNVFILNICIATVGLIMISLLYFTRNKNSLLADDK